ncbi:MAG: hypothetical protein HY775_12420 [Acidobacteria bacterium]|nr:hypothetical protein [Acidobacteriota bacterium]
MVRTTVVSADPNQGSPARPPLPAPLILGLVDLDAQKPRFNGSVHGWRIGPHGALEAEGLEGRGLQLDCEARETGAETRTDLDFTLNYFPTGATVESASGPIKWVCGDTGLSVAYNYELNTPYGAGYLTVERTLWGRRAFEINAASDRVTPGSVNGYPACLVRPLHETGLGQAQVLVIEDDTLDPYAIVLHVVSDNVPFDELQSVAEGVR